MAGLKNARCADTSADILTKLVCERMSVDHPSSEDVQALHQMQHGEINLDCHSSDVDVVSTRPAP